MSTVRSIQLEPGRYRVLQEGGSFTTLLGCQVEALDSPLPEMFHGVAFNEAELSRLPAPTYLAAGEEHEVEVSRGGLFRVVLAGGREGPFVGSLEVERLGQ